jgi:hypothetical protein
MYCEKINRFIFSMQAVNYHFAKQVRFAICVWKYVFLMCQKIRIKQLRYHAAVIVIFLLLASCAGSQNNISSEVDNLYSHIDNWVSGQAPFPRSQVDKHFLSVCSRLPITYFGQPEKWQVDLWGAALNWSHFPKQNASLNITTVKLSEGHRRISLVYEGSTDTLQMYFLHNKLIPPAFYHSRHWQRQLSRYFDFRISNPKNFHPAAAQLLDQFADSLMTLLDIPLETRQLLAQEKIRYYLCNSVNEVYLLSGIRQRGVYLRNIDAIVSHFNANLRETAQLLLNLKLQKANIYIHPFFYEGWVAATGGQGDKTAEVLLDLGRFLLLSRFMSQQNLLNPVQFVQEDPSLSIPVAAIYTRFLLTSFGTPRFLKLYTKYSRSTPVKSTVFTGDLPPDTLFTAWLKQQQNLNALAPVAEMPISAPLISSHWGSVWDSGKRYIFRLRGSIRLTPTKTFRAFSSKEFREIFPDVRYRGERYVLSVSQNEIKLFDFYTAKLIAIYATGLTLNPQPFFIEGSYCFSLKKSALALPITEMQISQ